MLAKSTTVYISVIHYSSHFPKSHWCIILQRLLVDSEKWYIKWSPFKCFVLYSVCRGLKGFVNMSFWSYGTLLGHQIGFPLVLSFNRHCCLRHMIRTIFQWLNQSLVSKSNLMGTWGVDAFFNIEACSSADFISGDIVTSSWAGQESQIFGNGRTYSFLRILNCSRPLV